MNVENIELELSKQGRAVSAICKEYTQASKTHPPFHSAHEGWAVLEEEVEELWDEVKLNPKKRDLFKMRAEAVQTAAMALRFIIDCCPDI